MSQALITHAPIPRSIAAAVPKKKADPRIGLFMASDELSDDFRADESERS